MTAATGVVTDRPLSVGYTPYAAGNALPADRVPYGAVIPGYTRLGGQPAGPRQPGERPAVAPDQPPAP